MREVAIHNHFDRSILSNDIALLHLSEPAVLTSHVMPICLGHVAGPTWCQAVGWAGDDLLRKMEVSVWHQEDCKKRFHTIHVEGKMLNHSSFICTSATMLFTKSSGSPLLCRDPADGTYRQTGVMTFDLPFEFSGVTGVYVNVTQEYEWIVNTAQNLLTRIQGPMLGPSLSGVL